MSSAPVSTEMSILKASKNALRREIDGILKTLSQGVVKEQSQRATSTLLNSQHYIEARRISVFLSIQDKEIDTFEIVQDAMHKGKVVFVPFTHKSATPTQAKTMPSIMDMLALESLEDYFSLEKDKWGIPILSPSSISSRQNCFGGFGLANAMSAQIADDGSGSGLDLIIVPGVAFDRRLGRLGHGKGYYDQFLARYDAVFQAGDVRKMPTLVGLALQQQLLPSGVDVPVSPFDWRLDGVVSGDGTCFFRDGL